MFALTVIALVVISFAFKVPPKVWAVPLALMFPLAVMCPANVCISVEDLPKYESPLEDICPSMVVQ